MRKVRQLGCVAAALAAVLALAGCSSTAEPVSANPQPTEQEAAEAPVVFFLGDSYTAGHRSAMRYRTYAAFTARKLGWQPIVGGYSGTGFVNDGNIDMTFAELFEAQFSWRPSPDMIIVSGGHNDSWHPPRKVEAATLALLYQIQHRFNHAQIVVIGPIWGGSPPASVLRTRDAIRSATKRASVPFIDPLAEKWFTGSRKAGTGNAARYILPDGTHPTNEGHKYVASRLVADLRALELAQPQPRKQPWTPPSQSSPDAPVIPAEEGKKGKDLISSETPSAGSTAATESPSDSASQEPDIDVSAGRGGG